MTLDQLHRLQLKVNALRMTRATQARIINFSPNASRLRAELKETDRLLAILEHVEISQPMQQPIIDLL